MTDIQQARDVLAKWREESTHDAPQPWAVVLDRYGYTDAHDAQGYSLRSDGSYAADSGDMQPSVARLIVGTSGNPELLDAIDAMFDYMARLGRTVPTPLVRHLEGIATAIIAADERMRA